MATDQDNYWQGMYQPPTNQGGAANGAAQQGAGYGQADPGQAYNQGNQPYGQQGYYQQPYNAVSKDHVAAALLAIFLGSLGVHKFYLGYNHAGFIMLAVTILGSIFTFGLAAFVMEVISFIEGIIYLTKNQRDFDAIYVQGRKEWF